MTAELVAETAMAWHLEAVGSGGVRGTGDQKTMTLAAYLYKKVIDNFTPEQFAKFEFPRIVKDDWPHILQDQVRDGGPALLPAALGRVRARLRLPSSPKHPKSPEAPEAAYAAVLCYQNIYEQTHKGGSDRRARATCPAGQRQEGRRSEGRRRRSSSPRTSPTIRRA